MQQSRPELADHPDRLRWNARYGGGFVPSFTPHPLAVQALAMPLPPGGVLELACGPSGSALAAAAAGRHVTAVDVSDVALDLLAAQASRRGLSGFIELVHADLATWRPEPDQYALVLCTGYWDRAVFAAAALATRPGGALAWEAFTAAARLDRPQLPALWCLGPGEPAALLPVGYAVLINEPASQERGRKWQFLARRAAAT
jgi:SAM-dependent methyltransferase